MHIPLNVSLHTINNLDFFILSGIKRTENVGNPINLSGSALKSILKHISKV